MGQDIKDLDFTYDTDSTASNSMIDGYIGKEIESKSKQVPTISTIAFTSSSNIQIGDRVVYNGPVTINQDIKNLESDGAGPVDSKKTRIVKLDRKSVLIIAGIVFTLVLTASLTLTFMWEDINTSLEGSKPFELNIISREEWGAKPPTEKMANLTLPLGKVVINHSVMRNCYTKVKTLKYLK